MSLPKKYDIHIFRLPNKEHEYEYTLDKEFFTYFEHSPINEGNVKARVLLDKNDRMIRANIDLSGEVTLTCDRSLDPFQFPIDKSAQVVFKFGDHYEELDDDIYMINVEEQKLNLAQQLFELLALEIPIKKLHPRFQEEEDEDDESVGDVIFSTGKEKEGNGNEEAIDPRWKELLNLKNTKNGSS